MLDRKVHIVCVLGGSLIGNLIKTYTKLKKKDFCFVFSFYLNENII